MDMRVNAHVQFMNCNVFQTNKVQSLEYQQHCRTLTNDVIVQLTNWKHRIMALLIIIA